MKLTFPFFLQPCYKESVYFLKYPYVGGNRKRCQIFPDGTKSNSMVYNAASEGTIRRRVHKEKRGYEIAIVGAADGHQVHMSLIQELLFGSFLFTDFF